MRQTIGRVATTLLLPLALGGCEVIGRGFLNPRGPVAEHERDLFLLVAIILLFVAGPVLILVPIFAWHYRLSNAADAYRPRWAFSWPLEGFIWIPPIGIVVLLGVMLWPATQRDDPYTRLQERGTPVRVQAIGLDWKWVFIYPDEKIATVDRLAIPTSRPVRVELTSGTVMQSMLLPQLAGQIYAMAGMSTKLNFAADRPGTYRGLNTQFNGEHFSRQTFDVVALNDEDYAAWLAETRGSGTPLDEAAWTSLSERGVPNGPMRFSSVPDGFYDSVVAEGGGRAHPGHRHGSGHR